MALYWMMISMCMALLHSDAIAQASTSTEATFPSSAVFTSTNETRTSPTPPPRSTLTDTTATSRTATSRTSTGSTTTNRRWATTSPPGRCMALQPGCSLINATACSKTCGVGQRLETFTCNGYVRSRFQLCCLKRCKGGVADSSTSLCRSVYPKCALIQRQWCTCSGCSPRKFECNPITYFCNCAKCSCYPYK